VSKDEETVAAAVVRSCNLIDDNPKRAAVVLTVSELRDLADAARRGIASGRAQAPSGGNGSNGSASYLETITKLERELERREKARAVAEGAWADEARALRNEVERLVSRINRARKDLSDAIHPNEAAERDTALATLTRERDEAREALVALREAALACAALSGLPQIVGAEQYDALDAALAATLPGWWER